MAAQKHSSPSFASIISVLSIVLYCAGFLRVELELKDQKKRINALENVADTKASSSDSDVIKVIENAQGRFKVFSSCKNDFRKCVTCFTKHRLRNLAAKVINL